MKSENQHKEELRVALEKQHGRPISNEELTQAYQLMHLLAKVAVDNVFIESARQKRLEENPKGFHLEGSASCLVCGEPAANENSWYDKYGIKCLPCQKALDKKLIPKSLISNKASWYSKYELERLFNIGRTDLTRYVKRGQLKKRIVPLNEKQVHLELPDQRY